jgi:hypothetical protein
MKFRTRYLVIAGTIAALGIGVGVAAVGAANGDDNDTPIIGAQLEQATSAALAHTGQGRVTETEVGDEDSYYEVEVTLDNGSQVDVQLDKDFKVVDATTDDEDDDHGEPDGS